MTEKHTKSPDITRGVEPPLARKQQLLEICSGQMDRVFDKKQLSGTHGEEYHPTVALGIFPTPVAKDIHIFVPEVLFFDEVDKQLIEYWKQATTLRITERMHFQDENRFNKQTGQKAFEENIANSEFFFIPSGVLLFNRPKIYLPRSVTLFSPRLVPFSLTLDHLIEQAQLQVEELQLNSNKP